MLSGQYICDIILKKQISENSYLHDLPIVQYLSKNNSIPITHDVTFFVGENGTGKSTLLEAIAVVSFRETEHYQLSCSFWKTRKEC